MNTLNKLRLKMSAVWVVALILGIAALSAGVVAYRGEAPNIVIEGDYIESQKPADVPEEALGGANGSGVFTTREDCFNGDCTYHFGGVFTDASTTLLAVPNPFRAVTTTGGEVILDELDSATGKAMGSVTSTVELVRLRITTAATSTPYNIECGTAPNAGATSTNSRFLISTANRIVGIPSIESGMTSSSWSFNFVSGAIQKQGMYDAMPTSTLTNKVFLTPREPWFICYVRDAQNEAFTGSAAGGTVFDGLWTVRISGQRY